jgi:hypothetical protein
VLDAVLNVIFGSGMNVWFGGESCSSCGPAKRIQHIFAGFHPSTAA